MDGRGHPFIQELFFYRNDLHGMTACTVQNCPDLHRLLSSTQAICKKLGQATAGQVKGPNTRSAKKGSKTTHAQEKQQLDRTMANSSALNPAKTTACSAAADCESTHPSVHKSSTEALSSSRLALLEYDGIRGLESLQKDRTRHQNIAPGLKTVVCLL